MNALYIAPNKERFQRIAQRAKRADLQIRGTYVLSEGGYYSCLGYEYSAIIIDHGVVMTDEMKRIYDKMISNVRLPRSDRFRVVEGDNFAGDYPNESFVNIPMLTKEKAQHVADVINDVCASGDEEQPNRRYWRVVEDGYVLQEGFEQ